MTKKRKHQLVVEITLDMPVTGKCAAQILDQCIHHGVLEAQDLGITKIYYPKLLSRVIQGFQVHRSRYWRI